MFLPENGGGMSNQIMEFQADGRATKILQLTACWHCIVKVGRGEIGLKNALYEGSILEGGDPLRYKRAYTYPVKLMEEGYTLQGPGPVHYPFDLAAYGKCERHHLLGYDCPATHRSCQPCELCYRGYTHCKGASVNKNETFVWAVKTLTELETLAIARRNHAGCVREEPQTV